MIQLCAFTSKGRVPFETDSPLQRAVSNISGLPYRKFWCRGSAMMLVEADEPADRFVFEGPEFVLICRADLTADESGSAATAPAAHLANLYERQGDDFVKKLSGTFAIIVFDYKRQVLKAWTDHFGVHPLAYASTAAVNGVATDLRLLLPLFSSRPEIDPAAIQQYLVFTAIPTPKTIYRGISRLEPAHQLTFNPTPTRRAYWDMAYPEARKSSKTETEWAADTLAAVRSAVAENIANIGPRFGCFLSGGTDSSSVAGLVGKLSGQPARTFSIGFDDPRYNEIEYARVAAKHFRTNHHEYFVKPADILTLLEKAVHIYDEPFGNSSIIPTYYCAKLAAENGMTHLLAGDGGDEIFGGNSRYVSDRVFQNYNVIPSWLRRGLIEPAVFATSRLPGIDIAARYVRRSNIPLPDRLYSYGLTSSVPASELFTRDFLSIRGDDHPMVPARAHFAAASAQTDLNRLLYLDLKITITDNDLRKVNTMSRLSGVTTRYPFLQPALAEFTGTIPSSLKVKGGQLRYLFKKAMADVLPEAILTKKKHGFGLPFSVWVGEYKPLRDFAFDVLGGTSARQRGYFRPDLLDWLWSQYETVHRTYFGDILWVFLMLELWHVKQYDNYVGVRPDLTPVSHG